MMNGHEKSDSVIVAEKPANKAAPSAVEQSAVELAVAEPVERRAETKGNADQQSTCRAQSRVSVSQARDRIRKVAKERKKERFTARRAGCGPTDVDGLRGRPRAQARGPARPGPAGSVSGTAVAAGLHTQAGRSAAPARGCGPGGQDRPAGGGRAAERDLRGRLPRNLVRIPAGTRHA